MRPKRIYLFYTIFFIVCFVMFVALNQEPAAQSQRHVDAILILLITAFSAFISYYDFRQRLRPSQIIVPIITFILVNVIAVIVIFFAKVSVSAGFVIPVFMAEGALVYWLLEKRTVNFDE